MHQADLQTGQLGPGPHILHQFGHANHRWPGLWLVLQADPLRESAHRRLMQIHLAEGNIAAALGQFDRFRELSHRTLGIEPSRLMLDLVAGIRRPVILVAGS